MRAVCLQHVLFEGPGVFAKILEKRGVSLVCHVVPDQGLPRDAGDLLIVMGGPMSVNDGDPWIERETAFVRAAIDSGTSVMGVCLGGQFMAKALGATVGPGIDPEIGMTRIHLTEDGKTDPVFGTMGEVFDVFEWHGEVFDLPNGAVPLASSDLCSTQAFRYGSHAYGLLFHLELDRRNIETLCRECPQDLTRVNVTPSAVIERAEPHLPQLHGYAERLLNHLAQGSR